MVTEIESPQIHTLLDLSIYSLSDWTHGLGLKITGVSDYAKFTPDWARGVQPNTLIK